MLKRLLIVPMLLVCAATAAFAQTKSARPDAMAIAQDLATKVEGMVAKQDAAGWAGYLTPSVTVLPASNPLTRGGIVHGRAEAEKLFAGMFQSGVKQASVKVLEAHPIGRTAIWAVGEIHLTGARPIDARYGQVLVRSRGGWKVQMMVVSGDPPPGGIPPGAAPPAK